MGRKYGSRHIVIVDGPDKELIEVDLNPFNHTPQSLDSVEEFFHERTEFLNHLRATKRLVVDAITGTDVREEGIA